MNYFVFNSESEAIQAVEIIDSKVRERVESISPESIDEEGLIPRNAATGELVYDVSRTTTWDVPWQRADGKWMVAFIDDNYDPTLAGINFTEGFSSYTVEEESSNWFPLPSDT